MLQRQLQTAFPPLQVASQLFELGQDLVQLPSGPPPQDVAQLLSLACANGDDEAGCRGLNA